MFPIINIVGNDKQTAMYWAQSTDGSALKRVIATSPASPVLLIRIGPIYGWFIDFYYFSSFVGCRIIRHSVSKKMVYPRLQQRICVLGHRKDNIVTNGGKYTPIGL